MVLIRWVGENRYRTQNLEVPRRMVYWLSHRLVTVHYQAILSIHRNIGFIKVVRHPSKVVAVFSKLVPSLLALRIWLWESLKTIGIWIFLDLIDFLFHIRFWFVVRCATHTTEEATQQTTLISRVIWWQSWYEFWWDLIEISLLSASKAWRRSFQARCI